MNTQIKAALCMLIGSATLNSAMDQQERNRLFLLGALTAITTYSAVHCTKLWLFPDRSVSELRDVVHTNHNRVIKALADDREALHKKISDVDSQHASHYVSMTQNISQLMEIIQGQTVRIDRLNDELDQLRNNRTTIHQSVAESHADEEQEKPARSNSLVGIRF